MKWFTNERHIQRIMNVLIIYKNKYFYSNTEIELTKRILYYSNLLIAVQNIMWQISQQRNIFLEIKPSQVVFESQLWTGCALLPDCRNKTVVLWSFPTFVSLFHGEIELIFFCPFFRECVIEV